MYLCLDMTSHPLFYGQGKLITSVVESCFPLESAGASAESPLATGMHQPDLQHLQSPTSSLVSRNSVKSVGSRARMTSPCSSRKSPDTSNACGTTPSFSSSFPQEKSRKEVKYFCPAIHLQRQEKWIQPNFPGLYSGVVEHSVGTGYRILQTLYQMGATHREARGKKKSFIHTTFSQEP